MRHTQIGMTAGAAVGCEFKHFAMMRHGKRIQMVKLDDSGRSVRPRDSWRLYWHNQFGITYTGQQGACFFPAWVP